MLLAAAALSLLSAGAAAAARGLVYGVNDFLFAHQWDRTSDLAAPLGISQILVPVDWHPGKVDRGELAGIPATVPILLVVEGRGWSAPRGPSSPFARFEYCNYVSNLVDRYPNIAEVQIWNEPIPAPSWSWYGTSREYIELLAACYDGLHERVTVLAPGSHPNVAAQLEFVRAVRDYYRETGRQLPLFDGYAVHPYWAEKAASSGGVVQRAMDRAWAGLPQPSPRRGLRFWWTETGMETRIPLRILDTYFGSPATWQLLVEPEAHADRVAESAIRARCDPLVAGYFNFLLVDERDLGRWQSGLYYYDGTAKPAFGVYREAIRAAANSRLRCKPPEG